MSSNFLQTAAINLIFGMVIRAGTDGDKAKESARASEIEALVTAGEQINSGQVAAGLAAVQSAIQGAKALDPAEALAVQNFISFLAIQGAAFQSVAGGTLLGQLDSAVIANVAAAVIATCQAYVTPAA